MIEAVATTLWSTTSASDWTRARCDVYPVGSDHTEKMIGCTFAQRRGYITITRADGVTHELSPLKDAPGSFREQPGRSGRFLPPPTDIIDPGVDDARFYLLQELADDESVTHVGFVKGQEPASVAWCPPAGLHAAPAQATHREALWWSS